MATSNPNRTPMYPKITSDPPSFSKNTPQTPSLYPKIDISDNLVHTLFPDNLNPSAPPEDPSLSLSSETLITVPGAILHLIDRTASVELACGDLSIVRLRQGVNDVAVFAHVAEEVQWPLAKDEASVRLDEGHYFFSFPAPREEGERESGGDDEVLNLGLTIATKGQDGNLLKELDKILEHYSSFTVQKVSEKVDGTVVREVSPADLKSEKKKAMMEDKCRAYWTTLAPNVEDYSGTAAKLIASGSGQLIKGILWCGDVTVDRLKWGNEVLRKSMKPGSKSEVSPDTLKRLKRVKRVTKMTEKVATGLLSGVVKVSGFFTSSVANSKAGKKFFSLLPGEIILASLDGFNKICDAVEVAGKNVMSTSSTVTTGLVSQRYGEEAGKATNEGLDAAGHAIGTAWAVFKIRKALNPKSALKPTTIAKTAAKTAAVEMKKAKSSK